MPRTFCAATIDTTDENHPYTGWFSSCQFESRSALFASTVLRLKSFLFQIFCQRMRLSSQETGEDNVTAQEISLIIVVEHFQHGILPVLACPGFSQSIQNNLIRSIVYGDFPVIPRFQDTADVIHSQIFRAAQLNCPPHPLCFEGHTGSTYLP